MKIKEEILLEIKEKYSWGKGLDTHQNKPKTEKTKPKRRKITAELKIQDPNPEEKISKDVSCRHKPKLFSTAI